MFLDPLLPLLPLTGASYLRPVIIKVPGAAPPGDQRHELLMSLERLLEWKGESGERHLHPPIKTGKQYFTHFKTLIFDHNQSFGALPCATCGGRYLQNICSTMNL